VPPPAGTVQVRIAAASALAAMLDGNANRQYLSIAQVAEEAASSPASSPTQPPLVVNPPV
jgi:hypothetical protein